MIGYSSRFHRISGSCWLILGCLPWVLLGCGSEPEGPTRYQVSGTVTYDGKPVPKGFITFSPDTSKGNKGPGSGAPIENGKYATPEGKGIVGGAYVISIRGSDGIPTTEEGEEVPDGKELFSPYETRIDLPKEDSDDLNFDIQAEK